MASEETSSSQVWQGFHGASFTGVARTKPTTGNGLSPRVSDGGFSLFAVGEPGIELPPGVEGLAGPDPEA